MIHFCLLYFSFSFIPYAYEASSNEADKNKLNQFY